MVRLGRDRRRGAGGHRGGPARRRRGRGRTRPGRAAVTAPQTVVHLLRHGEVYNPTKVLYGRLPGFRLSELGVQMAKAAAAGLRRARRHLRRGQPAGARAADRRADRGPVRAADRGRRAADRERQLLRGQAGRRRRRRAARPAQLVGAARPVHARRGASRTTHDRPADVRRAAGRPGRRPRGTRRCCVSHQLPIWTLRRHLERKRLWHDPRRRQCGLASLTSFHFDGDDAGRHRLPRAGRPPGRARRRPRGRPRAPDASPPCASPRRVRALIAAAAARWPAARPTAAPQAARPPAAVIESPAPAAAAPAVTRRRCSTARHATTLAGHRGDVVVINFWGSLVRAVRGRGRRPRSDLPGHQGRPGSTSSASTSATSGTRRARSTRAAIDLPSVFDPSGRLALRLRRCRRPRSRPRWSSTGTGRIAAVAPRRRSPRSRARADRDQLAAESPADGRDVRRHRQQRPAAARGRRGGAGRAWSASCPRASCRWCRAICRT